MALDLRVLGGETSSPLWTPSLLTCPPDKRFMGAAGIVYAGQNATKQANVLDASTPAIMDGIHPSVRESIAPDLEAVLATWIGSRRKIAETFTAERIADLGGRIIFDDEYMAAMALRYPGFTDVATSEETELDLSIDPETDPQNNTPNLGLSMETSTKKLSDTTEVGLSGSTVVVKENLKRRGLDSLGLRFARGITDTDIGDGRFAAWSTQNDTEGRHAGSRLIVDPNDYVIRSPHRPFRGRMGLSLDIPREAPVQSFVGDYLAEFHRLLDASMHPDNLPKRGYAIVNPFNHLTPDY